MTDKTRASWMAQVEARLDNHDDRLSAMTPYVELAERVSKLEANTVEASKAIDSISEELVGTDMAVAQINDREVADVRALNDRIMALESPVFTGPTAARLVGGIPQAEARVKLYLDSTIPVGRPVAGMENYRAPKRSGRKYHRDLDDEIDGTPDVHGNRFVEAEQRITTGGVVRPEDNLELDAPLPRRLPLGILGPDRVAISTEHSSRCPLDGRESTDHTHSVDEWLAYRATAAGRQMTGFQDLTSKHSKYERLIEERGWAIDPITNRVVMTEEMFVEMRRAIRETTQELIRLRKDGAEDFILGKAAIRVQDFMTSSCFTKETAKAVVDRVLGR